jgi:hypothetical protein
METSVEPRAWSGFRWGIAIGLVFLVQIALLVSLEDRSPVVPRKTSSAPSVHFVAGRLRSPAGAQVPALLALRDLLAVEDPTLFALPHRRGFSGAAWLNPPEIEFHSPDWSELARPLLLDVDALGAPFENFLQTNSAPAPPSVAVVEPDAASHEPVSIAPRPARSRLRLEGGLAGFELTPLPPLPSWTNTDLMTNSVVQVVVDSRGNTLSAVLLSPDGGLNREAGRYALAIARAARFEPPASGMGSDRHGEIRLTIGSMIFEWQAVIVPPAAPSAAAP